MCVLFVVLFFCFVFYTDSGSRLDQVTPRLLVTSCKDDGKINMKRECAADSHNWTPLCDEEAMSGCDEEAISGDESEDDESEYDYVPVESPSDKLVSTI